VKDTPAGRAITTGPVGDAPAPPHQEPQVLKRLGLAAVLVSSGVLTYLSRDIGPDLGTTLATKYAAGTDAGSALAESCIKFKVKFVLKNN